MPLLEAMALRPEIGREAGPTSGKRNTKDISASFKLAIFNVYSTELISTSFNPAYNFKYLQYRE